MNKEELIAMALQAGMKDSLMYEHIKADAETLAVFAKMIQEREREKFCAVLRQLHDSYSLASDSNAIRARGQA